MRLRITDVHVARTADSHNEARIVTRHLTAESVMCDGRCAGADTHAARYAHSAIPYPVQLHHIGSNSTPPSRTPTAPRFAHSAFPASRSAFSSATDARSI